MKNAIAMKTELLTNDLNIYLQIDAIMELKSHLSVYLSRLFANRDVLCKTFFQLLTSILEVNSSLYKCKIGWANFSKSSQIEP